MSETFDFKKAIVGAIERTSDPVAAVKLQEAYKWITLVGKMLTVEADKQRVIEYSQRLLKDMPDAELDIANANLIIALCGILAEALIRFGTDCAKVKAK